MINKLILIILVNVATFEKILCVNENNSYNSSSYHEVYGEFYESLADVTKISGGFEVKPGQFPSYAHILVDFGGMSSFCGSAIVGPRHIITAAHCVVNFRQGGRIVVTPGIHRNRGISYEGDRVCKHRAYRPIMYDVAVIRLKSDIEMSREVQPVRLIDRPITQSDQIYHIGLGKRDDFEYKSTNTLQAIQVKKVRCLGSGHSSVMCVQSNNPNFPGSSCKGDSGGGLYTIIDGQYYVVGLTSYGPGICARGVRAITGNADLYNLRSDVKQLLDECS